MARGKPIVDDGAAFEADCREMRLEDVADKWDLDAGQVKSWCKRHGIPLPARRGEDPEGHRRICEAQQARRRRERPEVSHEKSEAPAVPDLAAGQVKPADGPTVEEAAPAAYVATDVQGPTERPLPDAADDLPINPAPAAETHAALRDDQVRDGQQALAEPQAAAPVPPSAEPTAAAVMEAPGHRLWRVRERLDAEMTAVCDRIAVIYAGMKELSKLQERASQLEHDIEAIDRAMRLLAVAV